MKTIHARILIGICLPALIFGALPPALNAADVSAYAVYKRQVYLQTTIATPVLQSPADIFNAVVEPATPNSVTGATLSFGTNRPTALNRWYENEFLPLSWIFGDCEPFPTQAAMDLARPDGTYTFSITATNDGLKSVALNLTGDAYPPAPYIQNSIAARFVDASKNFVVQWDPYSGGTSNDVIFVSVRKQTNGNAIFSTPFLLAPGHLNGTATSVTIPAGTLQPGQQYDAYVRFDKIVAQDTTSYPGAVGSASYARGTHFRLATLSPPTPPSLTNGLALVSIYSPDPVVSESTNCHCGAATWPSKITNSWSGWTNFIGENAATFVVRRSGSTNNDLTVGYSVAGTATNGVDYEFLPGAITIPAGLRTAGIALVPISDVNPAPSPIQTVLLTLQTSTNVPPDYVTGRPATAAAIIVGPNAPCPGTRSLGKGIFQCDLAATNGFWFRVDESTNLVDWTSVCTNLIDGGGVYFVDPNADSSPRYYRAVPVQVPPNWPE